MIVNSIEEAITMANATKYSLAASVWTSNQTLGQEIAAQLRSGTLRILIYQESVIEPCTLHQVT